jgi:hypothetical protein
VRLQKNKCFEADQRKIAAGISVRQGFIQNAKQKVRCPGSAPFK